MGDKDFVRNDHSFRVIQPAFLPCTAARGKTKGVGDMRAKRNGIGQAVHLKHKDIIRAVVLGKNFFTMSELGIKSGCQAMKLHATRGCTSSWLRTSGCGCPKKNARQGARFGAKNGAFF